MRRIFFISIFASISLYAQAPFKILHYTETSGFDHNTRNNSFAMFWNIGMANNFIVDNDNDGSSFNSLSNLQQYSVVIFSNTSGDNILNATQRSNFEAYIDGGGAYLGIHAASDTYRHSTSNGTNTGTWDWYAEMAGASVQQNPNHVNGTPLYNLSKIGTHPTTDNLPDPWAKNEEYYYWESGYYNPANIILLEVEQTIGPNSLVNSYDAPRPMAWYKNLPGGGRSFYTALGHENSNYTSDTTFKNLIKDAVLWCAGILTSVDPTHQEPLTIYPNPVSDQLYIQCPQKGELVFTNMYGEVVLHLYVNTGVEIINVQELATGMYFLRYKNAGRLLNQRIIIQH